MQVTHLSEAKYLSATTHIRSVVKHKGNFSRSLPDPILYLSQALGLINLYSHQQQCHLINLFLMANSSSSFIQALFIYRLRLIQFNFLIPISPLLGTHLISWPTYLAGLEDKRGKVRPHLWYLDLQQRITLSDSTNRLIERYFTALPASALTSTTELQPCNSSSRTLRNWIVTLNNYSLPVFGKQLTIQPASDTNTIVHWVDPSCVDSPGNIITLTPCPGCDSHTPLPTGGQRTSAAILLRCTQRISTLHSLILPTQNERIRQSTSTVTSLYTWADIEDSVRLYYNRWDMAPDYSPVESISMVPPNVPTAAASAELVFVNSPLFPASDSCYKFIQMDLLSTWVPRMSLWDGLGFKIVHDASFYGSITSYAHGIIKDWPSSSRAEAAAVYAALTVTPSNSTVKIYTDFQTAIDGLRLCASSSYTNSRIYYKTTNFELWAIIETLITSNRLTVLLIKVKAYSNNYWNDFADSLANTAHTSSSAVLIFDMDQASPHDFVLVYDDVVCESNPR
ncbi:unnamed protein product [Rhizophagus irregularis]|nr:unnamed protein product [Rhizophagus irregularis]